MPQNVTEFGDGAFKEVVWVRVLGWALIQSESYPCKRRRLGHRHNRGKTVWGHREREDAVCTPRREASQKTKAVVDFQPLELWENESLSFTLQSLWYLVMVALANYLQLSSIPVWMSSPRPLRLRPKIWNSSHCYPHPQDTWGWSNLRSFVCWYDTSGKS